MMKKIKKSLSGMLIVFFLLTFFSPSWCETGFTQKDRELLIELKTRVSEMDKRIVDLREDMNKRFEQVDKRFEQVDKRFEQMMSFIWILAAIFAVMLSTTIGFAIWDRRTMIRPFETKVSELDEGIAGNLENYKTLIAVLKEYASKDKKFANIIQRFNLF
jgi:hypothetical protein